MEKTTKIMEKIEKILILIWGILIILWIFTSLNQPKSKKLEESPTIPEVMKNELIEPYYYGDRIAKHDGIVDFDSKNFERNVADIENSEFLYEYLDEGVYKSFIADNQQKIVYRKFGIACINNPNEERKETYYCYNTQIDSRNFSIKSKRIFTIVPTDETLMCKVSFRNLMDEIEDYVVACDDINQIEFRVVLFHENGTILSDVSRFMWKVLGEYKDVKNDIKNLE